MLKARYEVISRLLVGSVYVTAIVDHNAGDKSITNDAEAVVADLYGRGYLRDGERLIYRDTEGRWDEIEHADGAFKNFRSLNKYSAVAAYDAMAARLAGVEGY